MAPQPRQRTLRLRDDAVDAGGRAQGIVDQRHRHTMGDEWLGYEAVDRLVATLPESAVEEDQQRCAGCAGGEIVNTLALVRAIGEVKVRHRCAAESG